MRASFNTKVIVPVLLVMAGLVGLTSWIINIRIRDLVRSHAVSELNTASEVFEQFQTIRLRDLLARCRSITIQPRFQAVAALGESKTMEFLLKELVEESDDLDLLRVWDPNGVRLAMASRSDKFGQDHSDALEKAIEQDLQATLNGDSRSRQLAVGGHLIQIALVPIRSGDAYAGALAFGRVLNQVDVAEYRALLGCDLAFFVGDQSLVSSLSSEQTDGTLTPGGFGPPREILLAQTHFTGLLKKPPSAQEGLTCLLLASDEPQLLALRQTQQILLAAGLFGTLLGGGVTAWMIRRSTQPLARLRAAAEAIGRGEFDQHVAVSGGDELEELASAFNQMAENLKTSREKLQNTVNTLSDTRARLLQSEKLSAVGEFISGITHELNSPLTIMIGYADMLENTVKNTPYATDIRGIAEAARRCHKIVQNLLSFARQQPVEKKYIAVNELITSALGFLYYELKTGNIEVKLDLAGDLPPVLADSHQLQQVFLNLLNNARQAIAEDRGRGCISISTLLHQGRVRIQVSDDGPGIPAEFLKRIFDPFFTTKPPGKGTGLGLSVSFGIIKDHGGEISASSAPGNGATFTIDLPAGAPEDLDDDPDSVAHSAQRGSGRLLVVDDEEMMRNFQANILTKAGYRVEQASEGGEALVKLRQGDYDLILSDWKMPGMSGRELYEEIRRMRPELCRRFILVSGDVLNEQMSDFIQRNSIHHCPKPFKARQLLEVMGAALRVAGADSRKH
jgi:signal transduction histidine kinase/ActR/RegA family two-component response regulator